MNADSSRAVKSDSGRPFNPYHKWLGIRDAQTPPNHYRLLGLELWETDEDVIREAYSRQMNHVRHFWIGPHRDLCQQILDELLAARETLVDAQLRRPYDRWLKLVLNEAEARTTAANPSPRQPFAVHLAPATTAVGAPPADINCPRCGSENTSSRKFCSSCGESLWGTCIECSVPCSLGDVHCGSCGVNLSSAIQLRIEEFQNRLTQAAELHRQRDFNQAIEILEEAMERDHPRLAGFRNRAEEMIAQSRAEIDRQQQAAKTAIPDAQQLLEQGEFERAALIFKDLPEQMVTEPMKQLLDVIRDHQVQALSLAAEIRQALSQKQIEGLLEKVEQLLKLQPNHPEARKLHERLNLLESEKIKSRRTKLCEAAQAAIQIRDYARASKLLENIPVNYRTPEISQLLEKVSLRAEEIEWLKRDLRDAVVFDQHLLPLAQRLLKLKPEDSLAKKCIEILRKHAGLSDANRDQAQLPWPRLPSGGGSKLRIGRFKSFQGIEVEAVIADPERFCVAVGLALQGLRRSAISVNLISSESGGLLGLLNFDILNLKRSSAAAWGIDLGRTALKAVKLTQQTSGERLSISEALLIPTGSQVDETPDQVADKMQRAIAVFLDQANLDDCVVCVSIPAEKVIVRLLDLPANNQGKIDEIMQYEIKQQIPLPLDTVAWDYEVLNTAPSADSDDSPPLQKIAVIGAKLEDVQNQLGNLLENDIRVDCVQSDCIALYNFLSYEFAHMPLDTDVPAGCRPVLAMVDIGSSSSNVVLTDGKIPFMRSIHLGGSDFTRGLVKHRNLTWTEAENIKRSPASASFVHQVYENMQPSFQKLNAELQHSVDQYLTQDGRRVLTQMLPIGDGIKLHGLLKHLCLGA